MSSLSSKNSGIKDREVQLKSKKLLGKHIGYCVCGGIGSVEAVKIIRELRRHGAKITPFSTPSGEAFITPLSLEWAAGQPVVRDWQADAPHLDDFDLLCVAPATLNTLVKAAQGIADNVVTLMIAAQIGAGLPICFFPTMNIRLSQHPRYEEAIQWLSNQGCVVFDIEEEESRLKMPSPEQVAQTVLEVLG